MPIILVPTSHIAVESLRKIRETVEKEKPDCVAVELDLNRYYAMQRGGSSSFEIMQNVGVASFLIFWIFKKLQQWLGGKVGIFPGSEMLEAVKIGNEKGVTIAFIDRNIQDTFLDIQKIKFWEKMKLIWFLVKSVFVIKFGGSKGEAIDLTKLPPEELIEQAMELFKKEFPQLYKILVEKRDKHMATQLKKLSEKFDKIVAVVGAGHYKGMKKLV